MKNITFVLLTLLSIAATQINAAAWRECAFGDDLSWSGDRLTIRPSAISFPQTSSWYPQIANMANEWSEVKGSNFEFIIGSPTTVGFDNGHNEIWFSSALDTGTLGNAKISWFGVECSLGLSSAYDEVDIRLNSNYSWYSGNFVGLYDSSGSTVNAKSFQLVMLHELGHALGLQHSNDELATMTPYYPNAGSIGHNNVTTPHGDDRYGLRILYPDSSSGTDLAVGRYNTETAKKQNAILYDGVETNALIKGAQYDIQYSLENLGTTTQSATIRFYISTNSYISTADTYIGSAGWSISAGGTVFNKKTVTIPTSISDGTYYIGYAVTPNNGVSEDDTNNNMVALSNTVTIQNGTIIPSTPTLSSQPLACLGENTLNWNSISNATYYNIYIGSSSSVDYTTTSTSKFINVNSTQNAWVKACNSSGCSGLSNFVTVSYAPICL